MKIAIYFGGKLILFLFHPPPNPLPLREGVGGWGLVKIAIYFCPAHILDFGQN